MYAEAVKENTFYKRQNSMNKTQRKARLKHLNSIRDGSYLRKKQEAQRREKITDLLLQNSSIASWIIQVNQRLRLEQALMLKNHYAK